MSDPVSVAQCRDADGFAEIGGYGVLSDGRGVALVAMDGTIDWWPVPRLDASPAFAALLDPETGGRWVLQPVDPDTTAEHRYLPDTNILETTFRTSSGTVTVTDSLNSGVAGVLPWCELGRRVDGVDGTVTMRLSVAPGDGLVAWEPWTEDDHRGALLHAGPTTMGLRCPEEIDLRVGKTAVTAEFTVKAGERRTIGVVASSGRPLYLPDVSFIDDRIDTTANSWRAWSRQIEWPGPDRERVVRSALALKLLLMAETGAIAAAATTSLPESIGGPKNWDYRFSWIRDAVLTVDALSLCGLQEEVHAAVSWLLHAIRVNGPDIHVMYTLDGDVTTNSREAPVRGYRDSRPVRIGNDATSQIQLGTYGDLFGTLADWVFSGHVLETSTARELADIADRCADIWRHEDAGIWELQENRLYTSSKMNCWRALDAAARMAKAGHIHGPAARWRAEAEHIRAWVREHCWSETKQAYTFYAGADELDASVLLGALMNFDRGPRMSSTIDALVRELGTGPLMYRYSGVHREEETFVACAFWTVTALVQVGRLDEATDRLEQLRRVANPLGLMTEMSTPGTFEPIGNLPQALSHLAHITAAAAVRGA